MAHENDMTCIQQLHKKLDGRCRYSIFSDLSLTCRQMKQIYGTFAYTVGTRFHSVIFSLASGVPSIAITYGGNKGDGIMKDLGLERYALPIHTLTGPELIEAFRDLSAQSPEALEHTAQKLSGLHAQQAQIIDKIRK
jgi:colanic acid/amylovoran biosynthesis protein